MRDRKREFVIKRDGKKIKDGHRLDSRLKMSLHNPMLHMALQNIVLFYDKIEKEHNQSTHLEGGIYRTSFYLHRSDWIMRIFVLVHIFCGVLTTERVKLKTYKRETKC